jgi:hypothetical protein
VCSSSGPYSCTAGWFWKIWGCYCKMYCGLILENMRVLLQNGRYSPDLVHPQADPTVDNKWRRGKFPLPRYWPRIVGKRYHRTCTIKKGGHDKKRGQYSACSFGWWLMAGAGLFWEKSTDGWLLVCCERSTAGWWMISQANRLININNA